MFLVFARYGLMKNLAYVADITGGVVGVGTILWTLLPSIPYSYASYIPQEKKYVETRKTIWIFFNWFSII